MKAKKIIRKNIERSLPYYSLYRRGDKRRKVPAKLKPYLEILDTYILNYSMGLPSPDNDVVDLFLEGIPLERMPRLRMFKQKGIGMPELHRIIHGDSVGFGLVSYLYPIFLEKAEFCPFCHDKRSQGDKTFSVRLSGTVCPHKEIWDAEREASHFLSRGDK